MKVVRHNSFIIQDDYSQNLYNPHILKNNNIVEKNSFYVVKDGYNGIFYDYGDEKRDVTYGYGVWLRDYSQNTWIKNADNILVKSILGTIIVTTMNSVRLGNYDTLNLLCSLDTLKVEDYCEFGISYYSQSFSPYKSVRMFGKFTDVVLTLDISHLSQLPIGQQGLYIYCRPYSNWYYGINNYSNLTIKRIWTE